MLFLTFISWISFSSLLYSIIPFLKTENNLSFKKYLIERGIEIHKIIIIAIKNSIPIKL